MAFALRARFVFPVDRPPIGGGVVTIDGERIVAVGTKTPASDVTDLGDVALLPGLVNCHTHLEFSSLRRPLGRPGMPFVDWIRLVIAERGRGDYAPEATIEDGLRESLRCGVTSIGDITTIEMPATSISGVDLMLFNEVIAFSLARVASAMDVVRGRLSNSTTRLAAANAHIGISPHSPYTVSAGLLRSLVELACERGLPMAMHLAESREELELLHSSSGPFRALLEERSMWDGNAIPRGCRPFDYLERLAEAPRALVVHGNYLEEDEQSFLGAHRDRMSLVFCPRTHEYFDHPPYPLIELLEKNVSVALGTDSRASNPDLDLLAEMRQVARNVPAIDPGEILRMGTLAGAEALGRDAEVGGIAPGKLANLVAIPLSDFRGTPSETLSGLFAGSDAPVGVWLRGNRLTS